MLRRQLTLPAAAITFGLSLALTGVGFWAGQRIVANASDQLVQHFVSDAKNDLGTMVSRRNRVLSRVQNDIARFSIPLDDPHAVLRELYAVLANEPNVDWLFLGNDAGGDVAAGKLADGTMVFLMTDDFRPGVIREYDASADGQPGHVRRSGAWSDARQKTWFKGAIGAHAGYWTEPYVGTAEPILGISLAAPILGKDGHFAAVIGTDLVLTTLSDEMQRLRLGKTGRVFVIDSNGQLIASSGGVLPVTTGADGTPRRLAASDAHDPVMRATAHYLLGHPALLAHLPRTGVESFTFDDPALGETYAAVSKFQLPDQDPWTVVAAVPTVDFLGPARHAVLFSIGLSVLTIALALLLQAWLVGRALRPLAALTQAAQSIADGRWREVPEVQRDNEVGLLARAFRLMTTNLKETQDNLRRSEENYRSIYENATEGIMRSSPDGQLLSANPAFVRMLRYASAEEMAAVLINTRDQVWVNPHTRDAVIATLFRAGAVSGYEAEIYRRDGRRIWVWGSSRLVRDSSGEPSYIESFVSDITAYKQAEDALLRAHAELAHVTRVTTLGELTASIAHEVNQPLTAVSTNASACLRWLSGKSPDVSEAQEAVKRIIRDSQRASDVIQRIRALAKRSSPSRERLHVNDIIREVITLTRGEARRNRVSLEMQLNNDVPPVSGDRIQLQQVILNLLMNAVEAVSEIHDGARELVISSGTDELGNALVAVRDCGKGFDPGHLGRLFDAFYTTKPTGLGMGLRISRTIIEAHGGRLWAAANVPRGAVFQFTLPEADPG